MSNKKEHDTVIPIKTVLNKIWDGKVKPEVKMEETKKEGERVCPGCFGDKKIDIGEDDVHYAICPTCKGTGKVSPEFETVVETPMTTTLKSKPESGEVATCIHWLLTLFASFPNRNVNDFLDEHKQDVLKVQSELILSREQRAVEKERERIMTALMENGFSEDTDSENCLKAIVNNEIYELGG